MANIGTLTARLGLDTKGLQTGAAQARGTFSGLEKSAVGSMGAIAASIGKMAAAFGVVMVGAKLVGAFKNMITIGADFEYTMATVGGVMRATGDEMNSLTAIAKKMGETTEWTASQAGDALKFLGMAGFDAAKSVKALPGVLDLATAGNIELGRAADIATNALTAMNLPVKQLTRVNDVFIGTITRSNTNMEQMAEAFKYAAPVARAYGYSVEELSGLIGTLGDAGIQGSLAGTALRRSMQEASKIAKEMGFESSELVDVLQNLKDIGEKDTVIMERFGLRASAGIGAMLTRIPDIREFQETLRNTGGEAKTLADIMRDTVKGSFAELKSVIESISIDAFSADIGQAIRSLTEWIRENKEALVSLVSFTSNMVIGTFKILGTVISDVTDLFVKHRQAVFDLTDTQEKFGVSTSRVNEELSRLNDAFRNSQISLEEFGEKYSEIMRRMARETEAPITALKYYDTELARIHDIALAVLVQRLRDGALSWDEYEKQVRGVTGKVARHLRTDMLDPFEAMDRALLNGQEAIREYAKEIHKLSITPEPIIISTPPPIEIRLNTELFQEDIELATEQFDKLQQALSEKIQALNQLQDIHFKASLVGLDEITQQKLTIERKYQEMLKAIYASEVLSFVEKKRAKLDLAVLEGEELLAVHKQLEDAKQQMMYETAQVWNQSMGQVVNGMVAQMQGAEVDMQRIFKQMALDFIRLFIRQSLSKMAAMWVNPFLGLLMLFDKSANDRMAMKQGERYIGFFSRGALGAMAQMDLAPAMTQMDLAPKMAQMNLAPAIASASASGISTSVPSSFESHAPRKSDIQIVMNVNAPIISDDLTDWIVHDLAPVIERASKSGQTKIALEPFLQTGDSSGVIN